MRESREDGDLYHEVIGEGPPLLVMHGGLGFDHTYFRPWLDPLGELFQVIYYDHRGNGRSAQPADWSAVSHQSLIADADDLRARLGHERVTLLGHSYGGFLALEYALRFPDRLDGLILIGASPAMDYGAAAFAIASARATPDQIAALQTLMTSPPADEATMRRLLEVVLPTYFHCYDPELGRRLVRRMKLSPAAYRQSLQFCLPAYDVRERLQEISAPTLVLGGRHDWFAPPEHGPERLHAGLPNSELRIFESSGHLPFVEEPEAFVDSVIDWARREVSSPVER